ncbi:MAG: AtpZ/AtpI family protein [Pseudomonadota bacterium]
MSDDKPDAPDERGRISEAERDAFRSRSSQLGDRLRSARGEQEPKVAQKGPFGSATAQPGATGTSSDSSTAARGAAIGKALRVSTELIGGIVVGCVIGWLLDEWLGTRPWLFILFFMLGSAAGMLNVIRAGMSTKTGPANPSAGPSVRDDDDDA